MGYITYIIFDALKIPVEEVDRFKRERAELVSKRDAETKELHDYYGTHGKPHPNAENMHQYSWMYSCDVISVQEDGSVIIEESDFKDRAEFNNLDDEYRAKFVEWFLTFKPTGSIRGYGDEVDDHWKIEFNGDGKTVKTYHRDWVEDTDDA